MKKATTIMAFMCMACTIKAQEEKKEFTHDIGFNTNIILNGLFNSNVGQYNFIYKRQLEPGKAIRYGISFNISINSHSGSSANYTVQNTVNISPSIGKEWQHIITKKWIWYYGGDIRPNYSYNTSDGFYNETLNNQYQSSSYGISFTPFLGIRFIINDKLYVATEANFYLGGSYQKVASSAIVGSSLTSVQDYSNINISSGTGSAGGVFVFYRF